MPKRGTDPKPSTRRRLAGVTATPVPYPAGLAGGTACPRPSPADSLSPGEIISGRALEESENEPLPAGDPPAEVSSLPPVPAALSSLPPETRDLAGTEVDEDSTVKRLRQRLESYGDIAISTLAEVSVTGDKDAARVAAANGILDRIGLVKPREQAAGYDVPSAMIANALAGLAFVTGRTISPDALARIRDLGSEPSTRVSSPPVAPAARKASGKKTPPSPLTFAQEGEP
jgi:hypothetical protein